MKLPIIRHMLSFVEEHGPERIEQTAETLEHFAEARGLKDEELEVIGEILSNLYGSIEVHNQIQAGTPERDALNGFMKRVTGSIDT